VMLAVLEHLADPEPVLREAHRILTPGGSLILTWPSAMVDAILKILHGFHLVSDEMESERTPKTNSGKHVAANPPSHRLQRIHPLYVRVRVEQSDGRNPLAAEDIKSKSGRPSGAMPEMKHFHRSLVFADNVVHENWAVQEFSHS